VERDRREKLDALDLVIQALMDHEKALEDLVTRLERLIKDLKDQDRIKESIKHYYGGFQE